MVLREQERRVGELLFLRTCRVDVLVEDPLPSRSSLALALGPLLSSLFDLVLHYGPEVPDSLVEAVCLVTTEAEPEKRAWRET